MIRYLAALFLVFALAATTFTLWGQVEVIPATVQQVVVVAKPVRVYMIHDPRDDRWFRENLAGLSSWGAQQQAEVWSVKKDAVAKLSTMFGPRAKRCKIKAFVLLAVKNG